MRISIIAAVASNGVIGLRNALPWHLPADLRYFKCVTMGHHLIMGRKTFESVGSPLPGRTTIVVTRNRRFSFEGIHRASSVEEAIALVRDDDEVFIAGGSQIYSQTLALADRMYLTRIHQEFQGDTHFPEFDDSQWQPTRRQVRPSDDKNPYSLSFLVYDRAEARSALKDPLPEG
jgi:dihydrofolate reductase